MGEDRVEKLERQVEELKGALTAVRQLVVVSMLAMVPDADRRLGFLSTIRNIIYKSPSLSSVAEGEKEALFETIDEIPGLIGLDEPPQDTAGPKP